MSDEFIAFEVTGIDELRREFGNWDPAIQDDMVNEVNKYVVKEVKKYPPYAYVPYKKAYGGWASEKQRKYVMAKIREGEITPGIPNRTGRFGQGWEIVGYGRNSMVANEVPYGRYLMDDTGQSRMHKLIGWDRLTAWIKKNTDGIMRTARKALVDALKKRRF